MAWYSGRKVGVNMTYEKMRNEYISNLKNKGVSNNGINSILHHVDLWNKNRLNKSSKHNQVVATYHNSCINAIIEKGKPLTTNEKRSLFCKAKNKSR